MAASDHVKQKIAELNGGSGSSLKQKMEGMNAPEATATEPVAPATTTAPADNKAVGKVAIAKQFRDSGAKLRSQMTEDEKKIEGSKSDKVAFVCSLGDPTRKQSRVEGKTSHDSYVVVGYKFKMLEDTMVPFAPINENMKNILDVADPTERPVKAGEIVALNIVETAMLISKLEYAGEFCGEGDAIVMTSRISDDRSEPLPVLRKKGNGSIKENMELIADMVGADGKSKGTPRIKDEFKDSFGAIYSKRTLTSPKGSKKKESGEIQADIAAAFRQLYLNKARK